MDEFELIERFFAAPAHARNDVTIGIGDDGAVTQPDPCLLYTSPSPRD